MSILHEPLFAAHTCQTSGAGFHNIGGRGVLRASDEKIIEKIELHYGERCGHLPFNAPQVNVLVELITSDVSTQMEYLSSLYGKYIRAVTFQTFQEASKAASGAKALVVPYINVPEAETYVREALGAETWGIPGKMTHILKNKAEFYRLVDEFALDGFITPDYRVANIHNLAKEASSFLSWCENLYRQAGIGNYPLGVMMRASESDGNYGCCLAYERDGGIIVVPNGEAEQAGSYKQWDEALAVAQQMLSDTMNTRKEKRVVISRYIDMIDSPGLSVVIMNDQVEHLGWNGQLQLDGSKACVGTSTYRPKNAFLKRAQHQYEEKTAAFFATLLRQTARKQGIDFSSIRGIANIDIIIPGEAEKQLQRQRKQKPSNYLAECNPRWTNYTDAIMVVLGASGKEQSVHGMRSVIQEGICTIDKHPLPANVDPRAVRESVFERDAVLKAQGTRIICRMTKNPMGLIFAGDIDQAEREFKDIVARLREQEKHRVS